MPDDLDLGPNNYRIKGPDGRWRLRDDPKLARAAFFVSLAILGFIYWNKDALSAENLFWGVFIMAGCAGGFFKMWLRDTY